MSYIPLTPDFNRPKGWQILELFGIPVYVEAGFLAFMLIVMFLAGHDGRGFNLPQGGLVCFIIFISVLIHEWGHAIAARLSGCRQIYISLVMMGGYTVHEPTSSRRSLAIVAAGPICSFLLWIAAWVILQMMVASRTQIPEAWVFVIAECYIINMFLTIFNVLPIYPLDGGQFLYHLLSLAVDTTTALFWVARLSIFIAVLAGVWAFRNGSPFLAIICLNLIMTNFQLTQMMRR